jgi:hypothetical protein
MLKVGNQLASETSISTLFADVSNETNILMPGNGAALDLTSLFPMKE